MKDLKLEQPKSSDEYYHKQFAASKAIAKKALLMNAIKSQKVREMMWNRFL